MTELESLLLLVIKHDQAVHLETDGVWAGQLGELRLPPADHKLDKEAQEEGEVS